MKNSYRNYFIFFLSLMLIYPQYGKNIVQYDDFDWKFIQTKNFDVYYYNSYKHHAEFAGYTAEVAAKKLRELI